LKLFVVSKKSPNFASKAQIIGLFLRVSLFKLCTKIKVALLGLLINHLQTLFYEILSQTSCVAAPIKKRIFDYPCAPTLKGGGLSRQFERRKERKPSTAAEKTSRRQEGLVLKRSRAQPERGGSGAQKNTVLKLKGFTTTAAVEVGNIISTNCEFEEDPQPPVGVGK